MLLPEKSREGGIGGMKRHRRAACVLSLLLISALLLPCFSFRALALYGDEPFIRSECAILYEVDCGEVLYQKNARQRAYPASTTKIMTALLALENCEMDEPVTVTREALASLTRGSSIAGLQAGEVLSMYEMLECLLVASGNDAANVIAFHISGSISAFAEMMNSRALELGCTGTNFKNPSGLHHEEHYTTAEDLLKIAVEAMKYPEFARIVASPQVTIPPTNKVDKERRFNNTNQLISKVTTGVNLYSKATGIKTGHTTPAGYCLVSSAQDEDSELIAVVLGGYLDKDTGRNYSYVDSINLFLWGFAHFGFRTIVSSSDLVTELSLGEARETDHVVLRASKDVIAFMHDKEDLDKTFTRVIAVQENINAPVEAGDVLGSLTILKGNDVYDRVDLVAVNSVERSDGLYYFNRIGDFFQQPSVQMGMLILFCALVVYIVFVILYNRRRQERRRRKRAREQRREQMRREL